MIVEVLKCAAASAGVMGEEGAERCVSERPFRNRRRLKLLDASGIVLPFLYLRAGMSLAGASRPSAWSQPSHLPLSLWRVRAMFLCRLGHLLVRCYLLFSSGVQNFHSSSSSPLLRTCCLCRHNLDMQEERS